jgi:hypothetical protein
LGFFADFWKRKEIDAFATTLASQLVQRLPVQRLGDEKRRKAEFEIALGHAQGYQRKAKLGTFGKSRLVNSFQWALVEKGYDGKLARKIGYEIAIRIAPHKIASPKVSD